MSEQIYQKLRVHLDKLPGSFPATPSGIEIKILKKLFTPEEAEVALAVRLEPEPVSVIAGRLGLDEKQAGPKLESLALKGNIFRLREGGQIKYGAASYIEGIFEFQVKSMDPEFAQLAREYGPFIGMSAISIKTLQWRTIPVGSALKVKQSVATYNLAREIVKSQELIALAPCICRTQAALVGEKCGHPIETCMVFGSFGQYYLDNGLARRINAEEALNVLDMAEDKGMILSPSNAKEPHAICCCCTCGCGILKTGKLLPNPAKFFYSMYQAKIDQELCNGCGNCLDRCQMLAIKQKAEVMAVDLDRCIGCGLCVSSCAEEAIAFVERPNQVPMPANRDELHKRMLKERGLA